MNLHCKIHYIILLWIESKSHTIFVFQQKFPDDNSCLAYLAEKKWENGFKYVK